MRFGKLGSIVRSVVKTVNAPMTMTLAAVTGNKKLQSWRPTRQDALTSAYVGAAVVGGAYAAPYLFGGATGATGATASIGATGLVGSVGAVGSTSLGTLAATAAEIGTTVDSLRQLREKFASGGSQIAPQQIAPQQIAQETTSSKIFGVDSKIVYIGGAFLAALGLVLVARK